MRHALILALLALPGGVAGKIGSAASMAGVAQALSAGRGAGPTAVMGYSEPSGDIGQEDVARCLGLTREDYRDLTDPTHGEARAPTKAEAKRQAKLSQKADTRHSQECLLQHQAEPVSVRMSADPVGELRKGKIALRRIGWASGAAELEEGAGGAFSDAMTRLALALRQAGGTYRADIYLEAPTDKAAAEHVGTARLAVVRDALDHAGLPTGLVAPGKVKVDKDARVELVRTKR